MFSKWIFNMSNYLSFCLEFLHIFFLDLVKETLFWELQKLLVSIKEWNRRFSYVSVLTQQTALHDTNRNFYRRTVTLRTKMSYVSHFIFWVGCKCTLSPEPSSSLENFKSWCRYIVCFNTSMEFSTVDLDTCLKSLFFLKGVNLFKQTTNLSCQSFLKYCFIPVSLLRCFWAYSNMKRFKRKGNYESLQK